MSIDPQSQTDFAVYSAYFLNLTVAGIRCFLDERRISFTVGDRPARWTILLGDNGTGKTTILQSLA